MDVAQWVAVFSAGIGSASWAACVTQPMMQGQDPAVEFKDGWFHLIQSDGCNLRLRRSPTLAGLTVVPNQIIYSPGCSEVWAPEIHWISNRWYVYYSKEAFPGAHRGYVAESSGSNPYGPYLDRGTLFNGFWNIDGTVFTNSTGQLFYVFSGGQSGGNQRLYIAGKAG